MIKEETIRQMPSRRVVLVLVALAALLLASVLVARPAHAATFTVNSTGDENNISLDGVCDVSPTSGNQCTLRAALQEANFNQNAPTVDVINFNIPGSEVHTIKPGSPLPDITDRVTIDGYSQPGASPNTLQQGDNAVLKIELDGSGLGLGVDGLVIKSGDGSEIKGLVINHYGDYGIRIVSAPGTKVEGNFIGTDPSGTIAEPNTNGGVLVASSTVNTIGGETPAARNVLSGNFGEGVSILSPNNKVQGNYIGTDKNGTGNLGNGFDGVGIAGGADGNDIGGTTSAAANIIAFNQGAGVSVSDENSDANSVLSNSIFSNAGVGIDLNHDNEEPRDGVTANDDKDPDAGPNTLQNFPLISSAKTGRKGTSIAGKLNSTPNKSFTVQFFASPEADPSGNGEGKTFLGEKDVVTDSSGNATFTFKPAQKVPKGQFITATATNKTNHNTSEFSNAKKVVRKR